MFEIRSKQMVAFEEKARLRFDEEMVKHSQEFSPHLTEEITEDELRVLLQQALAKAESFGFTNQGPIRLYIELMLLFGCDFDSDPQYRSISGTLLDEGDQMVRAERIWQCVVEYNAKVSAANKTLIRKVKQFLDKFDDTPLLISENEFAARLEAELFSAFSEKVAYVGHDNLLALLQEGVAESQRCELTSLHSQALIVLLMFLFGHGCMNDPFYPWIKRTLLDEQIKDSGVRTLQLEKIALTWLDEVTAEMNQGAHS